MIALPLVPDSTIRQRIDNPRLIPDLFRNALRQIIDAQSLWIVTS